MTTSQHAAIWAAIHKGHKPLKGTVPLHQMSGKQQRGALNSYGSAALRAPKTNKISKRTVKQNGKDFHRGMFINCSRACARDGAPVVKDLVVRPGRNY